MSMDEGTAEMIYLGLNQTQLQRLFKQDHPTIKRKLELAKAAGVKPSGKRDKVDIWHIHEVAPYIVKPAFDIEHYIRTMDHKELPKILTKDFWAGLRSKQEYELKAGNLWPTEKVIEEMGEVFKLMKMSTLLMLDGLEKQTELTASQREIVRQLTHGMLNDIRSRIQGKFKKPDSNELNNVEPEEATEEDL